jgi:hypothetical protein
MRDISTARQRGARERWGMGFARIAADTLGGAVYPPYDRGGGMKADDAKDLRRLKDENGRLKRMVADQALDIEMLKEISRGNF